MNSSCRFSGSSARCLERPDRAGEGARIGRLDRALLEPDAGWHDLEAGALEPVAGVADRGEVPGRRHAAAGRRRSARRPAAIRARASTRRRCRRRRTGPRSRRPGAGPRTGGRRAVRGRGSSGRSRWRRSRRPARRARASSRSETISSTRSPNSARFSRACSIIDGEPSTPITLPSGRRSQISARDAAAAAAGVEHGLVTAEVEPGEHLPPPLLLRRRDPVVGAPRPSRPAHSRQAPSSVVVTGPQSAPPEASKASIASASLQRHRDVVEAVEEPVLDLLVDLEPDHAGGRVDGLVVEVDPGGAGLGDRAALVRAEDHRQQPDLGAVGVEDVAERGRDDRLEAEVLERPRRVLARGAAAEVRARRPGSGSARARSRRRGSSRRTGTRRSPCARPASGTASG